MQELNFDDASKIFEQAANNPPSSFSYNQWWEQQQDLAKCCCWKYTEIVVLKSAVINADE
ncbi:hypothetical protein OK016_23545 [Vibrio chagasii]|nr:hypothetical protein [Vibrio chagasii]